MILIDRMFQIQIHPKSCKLLIIKHNQYLLDSCAHVLFKKEREAFGSESIKKKERVPSSISWY